MTFGSLLMNDNWERLSAEDERLFMKFAKAFGRCCAYENSFAYIVQETRSNAARYCVEGLLAVAFIKDENSDFVFLLPPWAADTEPVTDVHVFLCQNLRRATGRRVVLRRTPKQLSRRLEGSGRFRMLPPSTFTLPADLPEDIFPQVLIDVEQVNSLVGPRFQKLRNQISYLQRTCSLCAVDLDAQTQSDVPYVIHKWVEKYNARNINIERTIMEADPAAYDVLWRHFSNHADNGEYFGRLLYLNGDPAGFSFCGRIDRNSAALYASVSASNTRGTSNYLLVDAVGNLHQKGISLLNLGGSETESLHDYKKRYGRVKELATYDVEFIK
ncbi:phosphatidylglycerol lysyltransferase domain-containing protein [Ferruginivarius sediminum]|uniref:phosphatidylglycerol lysyltransferase domain-containing protein n=1 Tax=Ferruginivarius sediminum TaxID=2661937 RepID=UPI0011C024F0|nr:phosphatidylglycerol lysyltransferase domain-containing protein [Ferruginivarius sediminum]